MALAELGQLERAELIAAVAVGLAALIVFSRHLRSRLASNETLAEAFFAGQTAAYVFLHLLPELEESQHVVGDRIYLVILVGFLFFYATDVLAVTLDERTSADHGTRTAFWIRCGAVWMYAFLVVLAIPDALHDRATFFLLSLVGISVHVALAAYELSVRHVHLFQRYGRWVLATAPLAGGLLDIGVVRFGALPEDLLVAVLAGLTLLTVFASELPQARPRVFAAMLAGVAIYVAIFLSRPVHVG